MKSSLSIYKNSPFQFHALFHFKKHASQKQSPDLGFLHQGFGSSPVSQLVRKIRSFRFFHRFRSKISLAQSRRLISPSSGCCFMAYAYQNQRRICVPVPQIFVDLRSPIRPAGFLPGSFPVVNQNPSFPHPAPPVQFLVPNTRPVIASGRYFWNPAALIRMEEERNRSLYQVMMIKFCAFSFFI